MNTHVDDVVRRLAPGSGPGLTAGARETMYKIMDEEPAPAAFRRRWRPLLALPIAVGALVAALAVPLAFGPASASALDIKEEGGYYFIEVKDMLAKPEVYDKQLRGAGLDVKLRLLPATPGLVGSLSSDARPGNPAKPDGVEVIDRPGECGTPFGCPIGIKVRKDFTGSADVFLGREARPGEMYAMFTFFDAPGEPMHCVPFYNKPVSEVRALLTERSLDIQEFTITGPARWEGTAGDREVETKTSVPDSMHVTGGYLTMAGKVTLLVSDAKLPAETVRTLNEKHGCQGG
ncbi:hypothetical protein [Streptosporangium subroseum]|uniref:hypothetical protein n=1 Tax=Streptosporangium subroseum TaxID=106412 RepID=UPI00308FD8BF|nr:hypothetical protein OHB15_27630 [Streptosporangium subroseum]